MENENVTENGQSTETQTTLEDALYAIEIVRKALESRPHIREGILGEKFITLSKEARQSEMLTPRFSFFFADEEKKISRKTELFYR